MRPGKNPRKTLPKNENQNLQTEEIANIGWGQFRVAKWGQTAVANSHRQVHGIPHITVRPGDYQTPGWKDWRRCSQPFERKSAERIEEANNSDNDENAANCTKRRQP